MLDVLEKQQNKLKTKLNDFVSKKIGYTGKVPPFTIDAIRNGKIYFTHFEHGNEMATATKSLGARKATIAVTTANH